MILDMILTAITALSIWVALTIFVVGRRMICRRERGGE